MILKIKNNSEEYKINLTNFTQLCGLDFVKKDFILDSITKYFQNTKYQEYEEKMIDNIYSYDGEQLSKKHFRIIRIDGRNDIVNLIKFTKTSILSEYVSKEMEDFDINNYIEQIKDILSSMYISINKRLIEKLGNIQLDFDNEKMMDIIQKSNINNLNDISIEENDNIELLIIFFNIIYNIQILSPQKLLVIIKDIDHLVNKRDYDKLYEKMKEIIYKTDTYIMTSISINNFPILDINNIDGVNVINDTIFSIDDFDKYKEYIISNYPINIDITDEELLNLTNMILQHVGSNNIRNDLRANIILKLLDNSLAINFDSSTKLNNLEISFLNS